jgi:hypothetical protein
MLSHAATALTRGLEPGEQIYIVDGAECWEATVANMHFTLDDTLYRVELGGCLSRGELLAVLTDPTAFDAVADAHQPSLRSLG